MRIRSENRKKIKKGGRVYNMVVGLILFLLIGIITGSWGPAAIVGIIVGVVVFMFQEDAADMRAYYNRRDYWAYGKEPDWKRRKRAEQSRNVRSQQKREDKWLKEQERLAAEKRRSYMEQMRAKRR